ncbi:hypothetical protein [Sulfitobacter aestuariivivens]|uniref:Uncharacterized protein n=1 Tax=Sulfitobacter aestuariivivens TaxID=2766981 RepID=A0A927HGT5_9RHOB|nr:hypothetical protein [Sulfitobacter aestuariivivens]MBD3664585.1 hypothetical protein [Sulfitobacter aestuariivivens]
MADRSASRPPEKKRQTRDERLKAALKANMARRKAQARARKSATQAEPEGEGPEKRGNEHG